MAKSKEQKKAEALERGRHAYLRDNLYTFCGYMPGGSHWIIDGDPNEQLEGMLVQCKLVMDKVKELKLENLTANKSMWTTMTSWDPLHVFTFLIGRKENLLELIRQMHDAHCAEVPEGDPCRRDLYGNGFVREEELNKFVKWLKVSHPKFFTTYNWMSYNEIIKPVQPKVTTA
ncbi:hypothetical protein [Pseudomonas phage vB_PaeM_PS119XW]|uniref:Uncharacterized protein n=1 Tax=Pseudomonas phage vB_PaeM_PS119XW TaxID=2601632 RepID=A0A5C1K9U7_9CAUD|nr:hypothetical protein PP933_gp345 [Pseudomonas phage vB_PaeM_PS119XW]QEM42074.1 hypothetical protein [Pseudomonas phage vB_PaeM_PS119XW]